MAALSLPVLVLFTFAACGDDDDDDRPTPAATATITATRASESTATVTATKPTVTLPGYSKDAAPSAGLPEVDGIVQSFYARDVTSLTAKTRIEPGAGFKMMRCVEETLHREEITQMWQELTAGTNLLYAVYPLSPSANAIVFVNETTVSAVRLDVVDGEIVSAAARCDRDPLFQLEDARQKYFAAPSSFLVPPPR